MKKEIVGRKIELNWINPPGMDADFMPWRATEEGRQSLTKLTRGEETAYLYTGTGDTMNPETHDALMKLMDEDWIVEGNVDLYFDGKPEPDVNITMPEEAISLELGSNLLPLIDPQNNAPLLEKLNQLRYELGEETGLITPAINVRDNLKISPHQYSIKIRGTTYLKGEIFLDRYLIIGNIDKLGKFKGWSVQDPLFRILGKWIENEDLQRAEKENLMIFGPLNILITHLKQTLKNNLNQILGIQETHSLLEKIAQRYPKAAEDFLTDNYKLRKLRIILHNLLGEFIPITDLVTILEVIGDNFDKLEKPDLVTEFTRMKLSRQICSLLSDEENLLRVFCLSRPLEQELLEEVQKNGSLLLLKVDRVDKLLVAIRKKVTEYPQVSTLLAQPPFRLPLSRLISKAFPYLSIISTTEISPDVRLQIVAEIDEDKKETQKMQKNKKKSIWNKGK